MNHAPSAIDKLRFARNNIEMFGLRQTLLDALVRLLEHRPDSFDREHSVFTRLTTGSVLQLEDGLGDPRTIDNGHGYEPTDPQVMAHILRYIESTFSVPDLSFVDLGCGRGRALLMASELPFKEVVGVELSPEHCEAARRNVAAYRPTRARFWHRHRTERAPVRVCCADVTLFEYPSTDLVVYLFNPFRGSVLRGVLDRLAEFRRVQRRNVHLLLSNPELEETLLAHPAFTRRHEHQVLTSASSWNLWQCVEQ